MTKKLLFDFIIKEFNEVLEHERNKGNDDTVNVLESILSSITYYYKHN